jgi:hypothetical protein
MFGNPQYGNKIDLWSVGLVMAELAGARFHQKSFDTSACQVSYSRALFKFLGTPSDLEICALPLFPSHPPRFSPAPWSRHAYNVLGSIGIDMLNDLVRWCPSQRLDATSASSHGYLNTARLVLGGLVRDGFAPGGFVPCGFVPRPVYQGTRHRWNVLSGVMDAEILRWLQTDPALVPGSRAFHVVDVDFDTKRKDVKTEEGRKFILAGSLSQCSSSKMCALSVQAPLPLPRLVAWFAAFRAVNAQALAELNSAAKVAVRKLAVGDVAQNGDHFLQTDFDEWFLTCGELCITKAGDKTTGLWREPRHLDGGASVLHMGLTLFGRRDVICEQGHGLPDVVIKCFPGSIYMGGLTGPHHQVAHQQAGPEELVDGMSVTVMMRTALFPHCRSRLRNTTPSPPILFQTLAASFRESLAVGSWVLPAIGDCRTIGLEPVDMPPPAVPSTKRARICQGS